MTDTAKSWIEERRAIHTAAPGKTWAHYGSGGFDVYDATEYDDGDMGEMLAYEVRTAGIATAIVDAHNMFPRALNALAKVLEEHKPLPNSSSALYPTPACTCGKNYPCPTVQAIEGAINE